MLSLFELLELSLLVAMIGALTVGLRHRKKPFGSALAGMAAMWLVLGGSAILYDLTVMRHYRTMFRHAQFRHAQFRHAQFRHAQFRHAQFRHAQFRHAQFRHAQFRHAQFRHAQFRHAQFDSTKTPQSDVTLPEDE